MRRPLFPLTILAPAQVWSRSYVQGSGVMTTRGPGWSGDGATIAACDEPAVSGVALPAGVAPPPAGDTPPPGIDSNVRVVRQRIVPSEPPRTADTYEPHRTTPAVRTPAVQP
jgi:hypothetical protein